MNNNKYPAPEGKEVTIDTITIKIGPTTLTLTLQEMYNLYETLSAVIPRHYFKPQLCKHPIDDEYKQWIYTDDNTNQPQVTYGTGTVTTTSGYVQTLGDGQQE